MEGQLVDDKLLHGALTEAANFAGTTVMTIHDIWNTGRRAENVTVEKCLDQREKKRVRLSTILLNLMIV
jgi:hypothetical protein